MTTEFRQSPEFKRGQIGERIVADFLIRRGCAVVPVSMIEDGGAPRLWTSDGVFALPDLDVSGQRKRFWAEVKTLGYSPWNLKHQCNVHGTRQRLVDGYLAVASRTHADPWIFVCETERENADKTKTETCVILGANLAKIGFLPCQASDHAVCRRNGGCLVYWRRDDMKEFEKFDKGVFEVTP